MAAPSKKRALGLPGEEKNDDFEKTTTESDSSSSDEEELSSGNAISQEEIQVDFEGRNAIDSDFHGIKQLLHQLFLKAHVNLSELTDVIIGQNYVGSVIKQAFDDDIDDDDDDDDVNDANDVFGITTVVNLTEKQNLECVTQLRGLLQDLSEQHGGDEAATRVKQLLSDDTKPVGLIINERFVNIPPQITIPLLRSLSEELKRAVSKKMAFDFTYFVLICKLYKLDVKKKSKKKNKNVPEVIWSNQEEEFIDNESEVGFEFSVKNDTDSGLSGKWTDSDAEMTPYRKVLIIKADKLDPIIDKLEGIIIKKPND